MKKKALFFALFSLFVFLLALLKVAVHLHFVVLPIFFLLLGLVSYGLLGEKALRLFFFLLPLTSATAGLFFNGYPFNYMCLPLFYLAGMVFVFAIKKKHFSFAFPGSGAYGFFLILLAVSAFFVFLRWSNLTLSLRAFLADTPVAPSGERLSFASIFPVVTLFLFGFSPWTWTLLRAHRLSAGESMRWLGYGYCLSFLLALGQRFLAPGFLAQSWWVAVNKQPNGGFSDFNAFGFFSGVLFLYQALEWWSGPWPRKMGDLFRTALLVLFPLAGIFLSGCRTSFLFVLAASAFMILSRRVKIGYRLLAVLLVAVLVLLAGGTLKKRMVQTTGFFRLLSADRQAWKVFDQIVSGRAQMFRHSLAMMKAFPLTGVGAGNFLFYLKYSQYGVPHYEDLPLNQYLLIVDEIGFIGLAFFLLFLAALFRGRNDKRRILLLATVLLALFFNFFLWFPECLILFWVLVAGGEPSQQRPGPGWQRWGAAVLLVPFAFFNVLSFSALQPLTWCRAKGLAYDYGFWQQKGAAAKEYRWSKQAAGIFLFPGEARRVRLICTAPLDKLPGRQQRVRLYWRGKFQRELLFRGNMAVPLPLPKGQAGFFEFRVLPTFRPRDVGISDDTRSLGIQVDFTRLNIFWLSAGIFQCSRPPLLTICQAKSPNVSICTDVVLFRPSISHT